MVLLRICVEMAAFLVLFSIAKASISIEVRSNRTSCGAFVRFAGKLQCDSACVLQAWESLPLAYRLRFTIDGKYAHLKATPLLKAL